MRRLKTIHRVMAYIYMPLLFCLAGYALLYVSFSSYLSMVLSSFNVIVADTNINTTNTIKSIFVKNTAVADNQETVDESVVEMPTNGTHYANLTIADASIEVDLYFGDSYDVLRKGVGQYIGSSIPGYGKPLLICGHNNGQFNKLQYVDTGDIVTITTNYGVYEYKVTETAVVSSSDKTAYNLSQDKEQLILYTCYPFDTLGLTAKRFFVYADKISGPVIVSDSQEG